MSNNNERPLPSLQQADTQPFWQATQAKEFRYQRCDACDTVVWYPRKHCTGCVEGNLSWHVSAGLGTVYTFSIVRQSYHPFFRNQVPYAVAYIDLDEGPRFLTNVVGVANPDEDVFVGQRVKLVWEAHEQLNIPLVEPA